MNLLSINYLHAGSPKYWYAIAPEDSKRFETLARSHFPGQANECNEFMRHKRCLLSPAILKKAGIKFTTCIQRPGDASELSWMFLFLKFMLRFTVSHGLFILSFMILICSHYFPWELSFWIQYWI